MNLTLTLLSPAMGDSASKTLADRLFTSTDACAGTISTVSATGQQRRSVPTVQKLDSSERYAAPMCEPWM